MILTHSKQEQQNAGFVLVDFQGVFMTHEKTLGELYLNGDSATMTVGNQVLEGKRRKLEAPLVVLRNNTMSGVLEHKYVFNTRPKFNKV